MIFGWAIERLGVKHLDFRKQFKAKFIEQMMRAIYEDETLHLADTNPILSDIQDSIIC